MTDQDSKKSFDIPVTQGMLYELRGELKSDIASVSLDVSRVEAKVDQVEAKVEQVRTELNSNIEQVRTELNSNIEKVLSSVHRVTALVEEQDSRNKYVLDGYAQITARQDKFEQEMRQDVSEIKSLIKGH